MKASRSIPRFLAYLVLAMILVIPVSWCVLYFGYVGYENWKNWGHQDFARHGVSQIQPAAEMDELFDDCRHYVVYTGRSSVSTWNATAFFGERYVLTMQVPIEISSSTRGHTIGDPKFYLNEVSVVTDGGYGARFSGDFKFGPSEWKRIYESNGDFETVGFTLDPTPVPNFQSYSDALRPSN